MVLSYDKLQRQIARLQEIADKKASQVDHENFIKYSPLFEKMVSFLKTKKVLLYGGIALNGLLPKHLRFYSEYMLPDVDIFSTDGEKLAKQVVAYFRKSGYEFTSASEALHPGTYKVYAEGIQILDITTIAPIAFKRLAEKGVKLESGLKTADPEYLRMTLHILLSQPRDSHRWGKVLERLVAFYTAFPVNSKCKTLFSEAYVKGQAEQLNALDTAVNWLASHNYVLFGTDALVEIIGLSPKMRKLLPTGRPILFKGAAPVAVIVEGTKTDVVAKDCAKHMKIDTAIESYEADDFLPRHSRIVHTRTKQPLVAIYEAPACVSYVEYKDMRVASIHTLARMLMAHQFSSYKHANVAMPLYQCFANVLALIMLETLTGTKKKLLEQFLIDCYGFQPGVVTLRKMRLQRMAA